MIDALIVVCFGVLVAVLINANLKRTVDTWRNDEEIED